MLSKKRDKKLEKPLIIEPKQHKPSDNISKGQGPGGQGAMVLEVLQDRQKRFNRAPLGIGLHPQSDLGRVNHIQTYINFSTAQLLQEPLRCYRSQKDKR